jgi:predicted enzyme related to lactoylglutathione lyase
MSNQIRWLEMASTDVPASAKFYEDLFGWPMARDEQMDHTMTNFGQGETGIGFVRADEAQGVAPGSVLVYAFVDDIDASIARAKELGAPILLDKMEIPTVGWMVIVGDPGGNRLGITEPMPMEEE